MISDLKSGFNVFAVGVLLGVWIVCWFNSLLLLLFLFSCWVFHFGVQKFIGGSFGVSLYPLRLILVLLMIALLNKI
jgi:hypothetical protein